jgi:hypothetical protein
VARDARRRTVATHERTSRGLTPVSTIGDFWVGNADVEARCGPFRDANMGVALGAAVGAIVFVTENATEPARDVRSAVETLVFGGSDRERCHADTSVSAKPIDGRR